MVIPVVITAIKRQISKRSGSEFARLSVEDFTGSTEVLIFPEKWAAIGDQVRTDVPVLIRGGYSARDRDADAPTFIVEGFEKLAERVTGDVGVELHLDRTGAVSADVLRDVRAIIETHSTPSSTAPYLVVRYADGNGGVSLKSRSLRVEREALPDLRALLGPERVHLVRAGRAT
jgi:DNA polymerase-3 subunit alpha